MYKNLLTTFFKIGLFTFGGGYAMIPLIEEEIVRRKGWMADEEILDIISVSQSLPGPIAVNMAAFIGHRLKGFRGALMAGLGVILPSFLIIVLIAYLLINANVATLLEPVFNGLMPAVAVMILISAYRLSKKVSWSRTNLVIAVTAAWLLILLKVHPILVIAAGMVYGLTLGRLPVTLADEVKTEEVIDEKEGE